MTRCTILFRPLLTVMLAANSLIIVDRGEAQIFVENAQAEHLFLKPSGGSGNPLNLGFNTANESIRLRSFIRIGTPRAPRYHALELQGKATNGIASLATGQGINPGVSMAYTYGKTMLIGSPAGRGQNNITDWMFFQAGYEISSFDLFNPDTVASAQLSSRRFQGLRLLANYSILLTGNTLISATAGYSLGHNYSSLRRITVREVQTIEVPDGISREVVSERVARQGIFAEKDTWPLRLALSTVPSEDSAQAALVKFDHTVYTYANAQKGNWPIALGYAVYLTRGEQTGNSVGARTTIGGIFVETRDLFDRAGKQNRLQDRLSLGLMASIPVLFLRQ